MLVKILIGIGSLIAVVLVTGILLPGKSELKHEVRIAAPAGTVWKILADLEAVQHYNQTVKVAHRIGDKTELGASRSCELKDGGVVKETVVGYEKGDALTIELTESPWPVQNMRWRTSVNGEGGGTLVSQVMTYEMKLGPVGKLLNAVVLKSKMEKTIAEVFLNLKKYAESKT